MGRRRTRRPGRLPSMWNPLSLPSICGCKILPLVSNRLRNAVTFQLLYKNDNGNAGIEGTLCTNNIGGPNGTPWRSYLEQKNPTD